MVDQSNAIFLAFFPNVVIIIVISSMGGATDVFVSVCHIHNDTRYSYVCTVL